MFCYCNYHYYVVFLCSNPRVTSPICVGKQRQSDANGQANSVDVLGDSPEITLADLQTGSAPAGITREWMESMVYSSGRKVPELPDSI